MAKSFKNLINKLSPDRVAAINQRVQTELAAMPLQELRQAMELTQVEVAASLNMNQAAISKMEKQTDMYVSTLRKFIEAMGGELKIVAHFPKGDVTINQFQQ